MRSIIHKVLNERPQESKPIKMRSILENPKQLGTMETSEEINAMLPYIFYINEQGQRTQEAKKIEKKTAQFFWESKLTIILLMTIILSIGFLIIILGWIT